MPARDVLIVRRLSGWFEKSARELPWRTEPRDPYRSLVSEFMLQQTQVSRVLEKFGPFLERFPTVAALAAAAEDEVLSAWSGLGYYRRARLLYACAKEIVERFGGVVPREARALESLPGIGRYTAGAIASIVFGQPEAIVDGNVCRVLQRLDGREGHAADKKIVEWAWQRAEKLVTLTVRGGTTAAFNEGLMELGATVCTPATPKCGACPLRDLCVARRRGKQDSIPSAKPRAARESVYHSCVVVRSGDGRYLMEKRPAKGIWASMWQPPAIEGRRNFADAGSLLRALELGVLAGVDAGAAKQERSLFRTTHRDVHFRVYRVACARRVAAGINRRWVRAREFGTLAISNAHRGLLIPE